MKHVIQRIIAVHSIVRGNPTCAFYNSKAMTHEVSYLNGISFNSHDSFNEDIIIQEVPTCEWWVEDDDVARGRGAEETAGFGIFKQRDISVYIRRSWGIFIQWSLCRKYAAPC